MGNTHSEVKALLLVPGEAKGSRAQVRAAHVDEAAADL